MEKEKILFETTYPTRKFILILQIILSIYLTQMTLIPMINDSNYFIITLSMMLAILFIYIMVYLPLKDLIFLKSIVLMDDNLIINKRFMKTIKVPLNDIYIKVTSGNLRAIFTSNELNFYNKDKYYKYLFGLRFKDFSLKEEKRLKEVIFNLTGFSESELLDVDNYTLLKDTRNKNG